MGAVLDRHLGAAPEAAAATSAASERGLRRITFEG